MISGQFIGSSTIDETNQWVSPKKPSYKIDFIPILPFSPPLVQSGGSDLRKLPTLFGSANIPSVVIGSTMLSTSIVTLFASEASQEQ